MSLERERDRRADRDRQNDRHEPGGRPGQATDRLIGIDRPGLRGFDGADEIAHCVHFWGRFVERDMRSD